MEIEKKELLELIQQAIAPLQDDINSVRLEMQAEFKAVRSEINTLDKKIDTQTAELKEFIKQNNVDIGVILTDALERTDKRMDTIELMTKNNDTKLRAVREILK